MDPLVVRAQYGKIGDALVEVGDGLGRAHREMVIKGHTEIGTLAIKSAEVKIEVELSAVAESQFLEAGAPKPGDGDGLGTLAFRSLRLGTGTEQTRFTNKLTVTFQAVVVLPPPDTTRALPSGWPWSHWTVKQLDYAADALARFLKLAPEGKGDIKAWGDARLALRTKLGSPAAVVKGVLSALNVLIESQDDATDAERAANPDGDTLIAEIKWLLIKLPDELELELAMTAFLKARALEQYLRGVLTGVPGGG